MKVGIVGAGGGGRAMIEMFHDEPDIELVGVCDMDASIHGMELARELSIPVVADYRKLIDIAPHLIINVTGMHSVHEDILRLKRHETELMGAVGARVLWCFVEEKIKRLEEKEKVLKEREILYQFGMILNDTNSMGGAAEAIVDYATRLMGMPASSMGMYDDKRGDMELLAAKGFSPQFAKTTRWDVRKGGLTRALFNQTEPIVIPDMGKLSGANPLLVNEGVKSLMAAPLTSEGKVIGTVYVNDFKEREFTDEEVTLFSIFTMKASMVIERIKYIEDTKLMSITDGLTGLFNNRYLMEHLDKEIYRAKRHKSSFAVIMFDIDHFKSYNDTYGHMEGNHVLKSVADVLMENVRATDIVARFGGEEFCVMAIEFEDRERNIKIFVERLLRAVENHPFPNRKITLSGGVSFYPKDGETPAGLIKKADAGLYKAKGLGRNRVVMD
ncbi:MAG: GGDEF domain-containing protein [Deltaproteobacteria bacterium]|nr:GGDEF domain-containing protein [Deltaproteobacteria bacterium]